MCSIAQTCYDGTACPYSVWSSQLKMAFAWIYWRGYIGTILFKLYIFSITTYTNNTRYTVIQQPASRVWTAFPLTRIRHLEGSPAFGKEKVCASEKKTTNKDQGGPNDSYCMLLEGYKWHSFHPLKALASSNWINLSAFSLVFLFSTYFSLFRLILSYKILLNQSKSACFLPTDQNRCDVTRCTFSSVQLTKLNY